MRFGPTQLAIVERRFLGAKLPTGRVFAADSEVGIQAHYLAPGLHFVPWSVMRIIEKVEFVTIASDELGVVTAADGEPMPSGRVFAQKTRPAATTIISRTSSIPRSTASSARKSRRSRRSTISRTVPRSRAMPKKPCARTWRSTKWKWSR